jgi:hypothetical protein
VTVIFDIALDGSPLVIRLSRRLAPLVGPLGETRGGRSRPTVWRGGLASAALEQAWVGAQVVVWR